MIIHHSNLHELVLSLADSRNRHRLSLEIERSRAAREPVRVERAHHEELRRLRDAFEERLQNTQEPLKGTQRSVEGMQSWLDREVGRLINTFNTMRFIRPEVEQPTRKLPSLPASERYMVTLKQTCSTSGNIFTNLYNNQFIYHEY